MSKQPDVVSVAEAHHRVREAYERGLSDGARAAMKRDKRFGWGFLGGLSLGLVLAGALLVSGCTPYAGAVVGEAAGTGRYYTLDGRDIHEDGLSAVIYAGLDHKFSEHLYAQCQVTHFSTVKNKPEVAINHLGCGVEIR